MYLRLLSEDVLLCRISDLLIGRERYHAGSGRKETVNKWIEPVFVGGEARDVVIKRVKGKFK